MQMVFGVAVRAVEYNENDDVISETEENGDITSSEYEDEKNPYLPTSETTTNGNDFISQTVYEYDPKGNVISETDKGENKKEEINLKNDLLGFLENTKHISFFFFSNNPST